MHKLLEKQLQRLRRRSGGNDLSLEALLEVVSNTYEEQDQERQKKDRSMKLMSEELLALNLQIQLESEAYVSTIMENVVDGILTFNSEGKIQSFNPQMQQIFGRTATEAIGQPVSLLSPGQGAQKVDFQQIYETQLRGAANLDLIETLGINVQGEVFPIDLSVSMMQTARGGLYIAIVRDISARKQFEAELIDAKEKAEQAAIAKSQFLSTMSHEIRTPMNAVIGLTNLMIQEDPRPDQLENLKILKFSGENLLVLINDILDFNKIEAGKIEFESIDFSLRDVANSIKKSLGIRASEKGVGLQILMDSDIPEVVQGDPVRLSQILNNLVGNAVKFTDEGKVTVKIEVRQDTAAAVRVDFSIRDTGIGIPPEKIAHIFESFTQSNSTITRKYGGTGLGLAITQRLVGLMGSDVKVVSTPGEGSTFSFSLVFQKSELTELHFLNQAQEARDQVVIFTNQKVLLVEDNRVNQLVAARFLKKWGLQVEIANNGQLAVEKIQEQLFDLILMDLHMPEMDGYTATRCIRALGGLYLDLPIVALTASVLGSTAAEVKESGMNDFVTKPFNPTELNEVIFKLLR